MNFLQTTRALRARSRTVVSVTLLCLVVAVNLSLLQEESYQASAILMLQFKGVDPVPGQSYPIQTLPALMATQVEIITSKSVALKVVDDLKLADNRTDQHRYLNENDGGNLRLWIAERLLKNLQVKPSRASNTIHISARSSSPDEAAAIANAFVRAYWQVGTQLNYEPMLTVPADPLTQASAEALVSQADAVLITPAFPPTGPSSPPVWAMGVVALLSGVFLGGLAAVLAEYKHRHVRSETDLAEALHAPFLGAVGFPPLAPAVTGSSRMRRFLEKLLWKI